MFSMAMFINLPLLAQILFFGICSEIEIQKFFKRNEYKEGDIIESMEEDIIFEI